MKVFISAGHGGKDPGCIGGNLKEKDCVLLIAKACKNRLEQYGINVSMSRTKDEDDPVEQEVAEANNSKCDLAVSFHLNASENKTAKGFELYRYSKDKVTYELCREIEKELRAIGISARNPCIKNGDGLMFINSTHSSSILIESFFLTNTVERESYANAEVLKRIGKKVADAIARFYHIERLYTVTKTFKTKKNCDKFVNYCKKGGYNVKIK